VVFADGGFPLENLLLHLQVVDATCGVFDRRRDRVLAKGEARAGGIKNADRFIGQLAPGEIAMRKPHGRGDRFIENAQTVMLFKGRNDTAQHRPALLLAWLFYLDNLEAPRKRGILFEILFVLGPCGGGDGAKFAAGKRGLEQVSGVVLPRLTAGTDHGVRFIDKKNDGVRRGFYLIDKPLQSVLKFAFNARSGLQQSKIETVQLYVTKSRRHISVAKTKREAFDDGSLADSGLAGEDRVVLATAHENVHDLANLLIAAQDGVDLAGLGIGRQVDGVLV